MGLGSDVDKVKDELVEYVPSQHKLRIVDVLHKVVFLHIIDAAIIVYPIDNQGLNELSTELRVTLYGKDAIA